MRRFFALVFLFLYMYNIVGYLALFTVMQQRVRSEIKKMLKESVPQEELFTFAFHTASLNAGFYPLHWIEDHEFRMNGSMYDIVRTHRSDDTTYFVCVNDVQEERLFANLDNHVQRHMGSSGKPGEFDAFKDVFKDSLLRIAVTFLPLLPEWKAPAARIAKYAFIKPDIPFPPPRIL